MPDPAGLPPEPARIALDPPATHPRSTRAVPAGNAGVRSRRGRHPCPGTGSGQRARWQPVAARRSAQQAPCTGGSPSARRLPGKDRGRDRKPARGNVGQSRPHQRRGLPPAEADRGTGSLHDHARVFRGDRNRESAWRGVCFAASRQLGAGFTAAASSRAAGRGGLPAPAQPARGRACHGSARALLRPWTLQQGAGNRAQAAAHRRRRRHRDDHGRSARSHGAIRAVFRPPCPLHRVSGLARARSRRADLRRRCRPEAGATFEADVVEIPVQRSGDREADLVETTAAIQRQFEAFIRARPGQWMWGHRRWQR